MVISERKSNFLAITLIVVIAVSIVASYFCYLSISVTDNYARYVETSVVHDLNRAVKCLQLVVNELNASEHDVWRLSLIHI